MIIEKAVRKGTPPLISLWGPSGSGKTYSALLMARGLVAPTGKIGMIDTENRRAEFYAELAGGWDHLDLQPPFTPDRYVQALKAFEEKGDYGCVIIDSTSHVWAGEGGVLEMADNGKTAKGRPLNGMIKWKAPKMAYNRMLNYLLRAPFPVIFCLRAKDGYEQNGNDVNNLGLVPISGKGFIYEMTISVLIGPDHKPAFPGGMVKSAPLIPAIKAPEALIGTIRPGEFLGEGNGKLISDWVSGGVDVDKHAEALKREAREVATFGADRFRQYFAEKDAAQKAVLKTIMPELQAIAENADEADPDTVEDDEDPFDNPSPAPAQGDEPGVIT